MKDYQDSRDYDGCKKRVAAEKATPITPKTRTKGREKRAEIIKRKLKSLKGCRRIRGGYSKGCSQLKITGGKT